MFDNELCYQTMMGDVMKMMMFDNKLRYQKMMGDDDEDAYA